MEPTERFPRGDGGCVEGPSSCQAIYLGFQSGTVAAGFVDVMEEIVALTGNDLHDARDLLAGLDAWLPTELLNVRFADHE